MNFFCHRESISNQRRKSLSCACRLNIPASFQAKTNSNIFRVFIPYRFKRLKMHLTRLPKVVPQPLILLFRLGLNYFIFKAALRSRGAFFMSIISRSLLSPSSLPPLGTFQALWLVDKDQSGYIGSALIGQNKGALRPPAGLSRVSHQQVCPCTSVQRLE